MKYRYTILYCKVRYRSNSLILFMQLSSRAHLNLSFTSKSWIRTWNGNFTLLWRVYFDVSRWFWFIIMLFIVLEHSEAFSVVIFIWYVLSERSLVLSILFFLVILEVFQMIILHYQVAWLLYFRMIVWSESTACLIKSALNLFRLEI